jgi:hypothetical protein
LTLAAICSIIIGVYGGCQLIIDSVTDIKIPARALFFDPFFAKFASEKALWIEGIAGYRPFRAGRCGVAC